MSSLDHFPDLCLLSIFRHLSTVELVRTVRVVCAQWNRLAPTELNRRGTLLVAGSNFELEPFRAHVESSPYASPLIRYIDDLRPLYRAIDSRDIVIGSEFVPRMGRLTPAMVTCLVDHLPKLTHLTIIHTNINVLFVQQLSRLIHNWQHHLTRLNLSIGCSQSGPRLEHLFSRIEQCTRLKHVTLHINFDLFDHFPRWNSQFYSQLETFNFTLTCDPNSRKEMLRHVLKETFPNCEISLDTQLQMSDLLQLEHAHVQTVEKIVSIKIIDWLNLNSYLHLHLITSRYVGLASLTLHLNNMPLSMLARALSSLSNLVHLNLHIRDCQIPLEDHPKPENNARACSVRLLTLHIATQSHLDIARLRLAESFPNVEVVSLWHSSATYRDCGYDDSNDGDNDEDAQGNGALKAQCTRLARDSLRQLAQLHTIQLCDGVGREEKVISIDQL